MLTLAGGSIPAIAAEKPAFITFGESADAPAGYLEMCEREPGLCQAAGVKAAPAPAPEPSVAETTENVVKEPIAIAVEELPAKLHTASLAKKDLTKRGRKAAESRESWRRQSENHAVLLSARSVR